MTPHTAEPASPEGRDGRRPAQRAGAAGSGWPAWMAPAALVTALVVAALGGVIVDLPAAALGVKITTSHIPPGIEIADTALQDVAFVLVAWFFAQLGGRRVGAWQFGLRPPRRLWRALGLAALLALAFLAFLAIWSAAVHPSKEKLLEQLGTRESTVLLVLSAGLTCVIAPVCEEFLFRGFIFGALRTWRGPWLAAVLTGILFGAVHAGSAPAADLVPLGVLGLLLCVLYERTGSLYPCIGLHALNNSIAFGALEEWSPLGVLALIVAALGLIALLARALIGAGVISSEPRAGAADPVAISPGG
jgi:uncharacterized protein